VQNIAYIMILRGYGNAIALSTSLCSCNLLNDIALFQIILNF